MRVRENEHSILDKVKSLNVRIYISCLDIRPI